MQNRGPNDKKRTKLLFDPDFLDAPGVPLVFGASSFASIDFHAKAYLRFKPNGESSIWVTLARYDWKYQCSATKLNTGPYSVTHIPTSDPDFNHDVAFPYWEKKVPTN